MNYFLDVNEGDKHYNSKTQLFDILSRGKVEIFNHQLRKIDFDITKGYLQMESFLLCDKSTNEYNYINKPLYNNSKQVCKNFLIGKDYCCDFNNQSKIIDNLPCKECINKNELLKGFGIGYTPDIAYIINDEHKIWFEINNRHPCTPEKQWFCRDNNIILLELDAQYFNGDINKIFFNELNYYDFEDSRNKEYISNIHNIINNKGFATEYDLHTYKVPYYLDKEFLNYYGLSYINEYDKYIADLIGYRNNKLISLIIENKKYDEIFKNYIYSKEKHYSDLLNLLEIKVMEELSDIGYYKQSEAYEFIQSNYYPASNNEMLAMLDIICDKLGLVNTQEYDKKKIIVKGRPKLMILKSLL
jgi:hypothetical protein